MRCALYPILRSCNEHFSSRPVEKRPVALRFSKHERYVDRTILVSGRIAFGYHNTVLYDDFCGSSGRQDAELLIPNRLYAPTVHFEGDPRSEEVLAAFRRDPGKVETACATLEGQLFFKKTFKTFGEGSALQGNGYGHLGRHRSGFVVKSVLHIQPCEP